MSTDFSSPLVRMGRYYVITGVYGLASPPRSLTLTHSSTGEIPNRSRCRCPRTFCETRYVMRDSRPTDPHGSGAKNRERLIGCHWMAGWRDAHRLKVGHVWLSFLSQVGVDHTLVVSFPYPCRYPERRRISRPLLTVPIPVQIRPGRMNTQHDPWVGIPADVLLEVKDFRLVRRLKLPH